MLFLFYNIQFCLYKISCPTSASTLNKAPSFTQGFGRGHPCPIDTSLVPSFTWEQSTHQCQCFDFTMAFSQKFLGKCIIVQIVIIEDHWFCLALNCHQINDFICFYIITQVSDLSPSWTSCFYLKLQDRIK